MSRLGYERYAVQGTDVGSGVASILGMVDAQRVVGMHLTGTVAAMPFGPLVELEGLSDAYGVLKQEQKLQKTTQPVEAIVLIS